MLNINPQKTNESGQKIANQEVIAEEVALEEERANRLALAQEFSQVNNRINEVSEKMSYFGHSPSYLKYLTLFGLAFLCDGLDVAAYLLPVTVIGVAFSVLIFFGVIAIQIGILFVFWFFDGQIKEARGYPDTANFIKKDITARLQNISKINKKLKALRVARTTEEIAETTKILRTTQLAARTARFTRIAKFAGNPMFRLGTGVFIEMFPIVELAPIMLICVYLSYRAENRLIQEARESAEEVHQEITFTAAQLI